MSVMPMISAPCARVALPLAAMVLALAGCASGPVVRTHVDPAVNLGDFKTFTFVRPLGTENKGYRSVVSERLAQATQRELEARGLRRNDAQPQLLVNFNARLSQKMRADPVDVGQGMQGGYYSYRSGGGYGTWDAYSDETFSGPYADGTLNIDVVNAASHKLMWEGVVTNALTDDQIDNIQPVIDQAVAAAFAKYPVPTGSKPGSN